MTTGAAVPARTLTSLVNVTRFRPRSIRFAPFLDVNGVGG